MPLSFGNKVILREIEKKEEHRAWEMWLTKYPQMDKKSFIPFSKFYKKIKEPLVHIPTEDILKDIEEIRTRQKEGEQNGTV
jgi:hypothetical protein